MVTFSGKFVLGSMGNYDMMTQLGQVTVQHEFQNGIGDSATPQTVFFQT